MRIDVYGSGFTVTEFSPQGYEAAVRLCRYVGQYEWKKHPDGSSEKKLTGVYAGRTKDAKEFTFHKVYLKKFQRMLSDYAPSEEVRYVRHKLPQAFKISVTLLDKRPPRPAQADAVDFIFAPPKIIDEDSENTRYCAVILGPGRGKTFVAIRALVRAGVRVVLILRAQYVDKWIGDLQKALDLVPGDLDVVRGGDALRKLMALGLAGTLTSKVSLISNSTYRNYIADYELYGQMIKSMGYCFTPQEFFGGIGAGMLGIDEIHQDWHFNLRLMAYSHVSTIFGLSGTLRPDDPFKREITDTVFPLELCVSEPPPPPYLKVTALEYKFAEPGKIRYKNKGRTDYSHDALEKYILKEKTTLRNYLNMIRDIVKLAFMDGYRPGKRFLVFASRIEMCTWITTVLAKDYPDLKVLRYCGPDPYSNVEEFDILVSTKGSCGTAIDMPGLEKILMTTAIGDSQANLQIIKRVRDPEMIEGGEDYDPEFAYLMSLDIPQHGFYHDKKRDIFRGECVSHTHLVTDYVI